MVRRRSTLDRLVSGVAGSLLAIVTLGLTALIASDLGGLPSAFIFFVCIYPIMACFGLDLAIQAFRGAPRNSGFFYRILRKLSWVRPAGLSVGIPVLLGLAIAGSAATHHTENLQIALALGMFWLAFFANVAVHELGHFAAARFVGLAPFRIIMGPVELVRTPRGWRPRLSKEWISVFGGIVLTAAVPPPTDRQWIALAAGGPAGSLGLLLIFLAWNPYPFADLVKVYRPGPALVLFGALGAMVMLVVNLVPLAMTPAGYPTDGYVIRRSIRRLRSARVGAV